MHKLDQHFLSFYRSIVHHPFAWLFGWATAIAIIVALVMDKTSNFSEIKYDNGPYIYFTEDNQDFQNLLAMESTYATDTSLIFLVTAKDDADIFNSQTLAAIETLTELAWSLPYATRVDSISNFQHTKVDNDDLTTNFLYESGEHLSQEQISAIRKIALSEKSLVSQSVSKSGRAASVVVRLMLDEAQTKALELMPFAHQLKNRILEQYPNIEIQLLGDAPSAEATDKASQETFRRITPIALLLVLGCLAVLLRNGYSVIACQIIIGLSIALGYALFMLADFKLSPISSGASPIILTLAVADAIHILVSYQFHCAKASSKQEAMIESLRINFSPVWLTSITTGMGFLFMNFAEAPPFHDLGNAVFFGVIMAFLLSTTFLPALMMLFPKPKSHASQQHRGLIHSLAMFTIKHRKRLLYGTSTLVLILVACIPLNRVNDFLLEYFDETFEVRRALDTHFELMGGLQRLQYNVPSGQQGGVTDPEYLLNVEALTSWLEANPNVSHVRAFTDVVKRLNRNMNGGDPSFYRIPNDQALISQYLLMYEMGLPFGLGLDAQVDINKSETKLEIVFYRLESNELVHERNKINEWIRHNWPISMQTQATGMDSLFSDITFENVYSMMIGTALALAAVSVLLIFSLRSFKYGLLSLIPNLLPAAMTLGFWGIVNGELGIVVSIIACMTLGIIVDDTVHLLSKYTRARREMGLSHNEASVYAFETVGVALIATSIILVANFGIMGFSHYYPNEATGILTSITISFALLIDFFFFMPLLLTIDSKKPTMKKAATYKAAA
ncbi:MAG: efflux RND transporter permease subunit [Pseudomonadales bacterium]|nr:efflux RND transporter permease subunit [Pseudomonadales bacterium]